MSNGGTPLSREDREYFERKEKQCEECNGSGIEPGSVNAADDGNDCDYCKGTGLKNQSVSKTELNPPIPPNCDNFVFIDGEYFFTIPNEMLGNQIFICVREPDIKATLHIMWVAFKPIIAAVARCAWLDIPNNSKMYMAQQNAEAWRTWGLK